MSVPVVCFGAVNLDLIYRVEDLGPFLELAPLVIAGGETALDAGQEERLRELLARQARLVARSGGGQAANTAFALARLGIPAALIGRVGQDADGTFLKEGLKRVNLEHLKEEGVSGRAYVLVEAGGERTIFVAPNTNDELREEDIPWELLKKANFVHFTSFVGDGPLRVQEKAAQSLRPGEGKAVSLDPGELYARRGHEKLKGLLECIETLVLTEAEWLLLGGHMDCHPAWAPPYVLIKRGARGARLLMEGYFQDFPADLPDKLVDTLGAGDVFAAGYLAGRALGRRLVTSIRLAIKAATYSLKGAGREHYPNEKFLQEQLAKMR